MKIIAVIPARYQSSRFPGKPLAKIQGKPMIQWVYEVCEKADKVDGVYVATDDRRIYDTVTGFDGKALMTGAQCLSGTDRVAEASRILNLAGTDLLINVQGDQPLMDPACLGQVIEPFFIDVVPPDMTTLAVPITRPEEITNPKDVKVTFNALNNALYFSRSPIPLGRDEDSGYTVYKHLGIYAYTRSFLMRFTALEQGRLERIERLEQLRALEHGFDIRVAVTESDSPEVDLLSDIPRIEALLLSRHA